MQVGLRGRKRSTAQPQGPYANQARSDMAGRPTNSVERASALVAFKSFRNFMHLRLHF